RLTALGDDACSAVGLAKVDLLGSKSLAALADGTATAELLSAPEQGDAAAAASLIAAGDVAGIPQLEAPLSRRMLRRVRPADERELADALALARPGAAGWRETYLRRRHGPA